MLTAQQHFHDFGWCVARAPTDGNAPTHRACSIGQAIAAAAALLPDSKGDTISGGVLQCDIDKLQERGDFSAVLAARVKQLAADLLSDVSGIAHRALHPFACKLLRARTGCGLQLIHYDQIEAFATRGWYSVLLVGSSGHKATALPVVPLEQLQPVPTAEQAGRDLAHMSRDAHLQQQQQRMRACYPHIFDRAQYQTEERVFVGDAVVFTNALPHFGMDNDLHADRVMLFLLFCGTDTCTAQHGKQASVGVVWNAVALADGG
jgi:hypothetical protein